MPRPDLLALDADALIDLSNRGIVKRAQTEVESGQLACDLTEDASGAVTVRWSDDVECLLPPGKPLSDARCTCPATTLCRHLVRSVLAYQRATAGGRGAGDSHHGDTVVGSVGSMGSVGSVGREETSHTSHTSHTPHTTPTSPQEPWDPGRIPDETLEREIRKADLQRARRLFDEGQVLELIRGVKPSAQIHTLSSMVRFLVPGDLGYARCDCAEGGRCVHVPLAVWAFRLLDASAPAGIVSTHREALPVPSALLDDVERALADLAVVGISGAPRALADRLRGLEGRCREEGLAWPAEILAELVQQREAYTGHDARFSPVEVAELAAEWLLRADAIRSDTGAVPQLFVRGSSADRLTEVGSTRLVGLGCGVKVRRGSVELVAYLQDVRSGSVVAISRDFPDPPAGDPSPPKEFWQLAQTPVMKGISLGALGTGQLLIEGGKRTASYRFIPGRARAAYNPQSFQWQSLRPPVLAEELAALSAGLASQPPASLRPRRVGANLHVCPVAGVEGVVFDEVHQELQAILRDDGGNLALLSHPYAGRAHDGMEALLARLNAGADRLRFVAGEVRLGPTGLVIAPVALVFEEGAGRAMLQPWVDRLSSAAAERAERSTLHPPRGHPRSASVGGAERPDPVAEYPEQVMTRAGEQWLLGLDRADERTAASWHDLRERGASLGFSRLLDPITRLVEALEGKRSTLRWDPAPAASALLELGALGLLAREVITTVPNT